MTRRHLGLLDATAIYAGIILGSGIFVAPAAVASATASAPAAVAAWLGGALVAACGASCYAECAARMPRNGGFFVFHREAYGPAIAFVGGWVAVFVTYPASIAAIALVLARYAAEAAGLEGHDRLLAAGALAAASVVNVAGLRTGPRMQVALTGSKVAALAALAVAVVAGRSHGAALPAAGAVPAAAWFPAALVVLWTYDGWSDVTLVAGEVADPGRNLGRSVALGTGILFAMYALVQLAVGAALPPGEASASSRPFADAVAAAVSPGAGRGVAILVVVCTFGSIAATILTVSRLCAAMAREGAVPRSFGAAHARWGTPVPATAMVTCASLVYVASSSFRGILAAFTFSVWIFYGLTAVALLILRRRGVGEPPGWRAPLGALPPAVVLAAGAALVAAVVANAPRSAALGAAMIAAGFPAYAFLARRTSARAGGGRSR